MKFIQTCIEIVWIIAMVIAIGMTVGHLMGITTVESFWQMWQWPVWLLIAYVALGFLRWLVDKLDNMDDHYGTLTRKDWRL